MLLRQCSGSRAGRGGLSCRRGGGSQDDRGLSDFQTKGTGNPQVPLGPASRNDPDTPGTRDALKCSAVRPSHVGRPTTRPHRSGGGGGGRASSTISSRYSCVGNGFDRVAHRGRNRQQRTAQLSPLSTRHPGAMSRAWLSRISGAPLPNRGPRHSEHLVLRCCCDHGPCRGRQPQPPCPDRHQLGDFGRTLVETPCAVRDSCP